MPRILAIETSCDETAAAVVADGRVILSNVIASQAASHAQYGGVFPEVASRMHIEVIYAVVQAALNEAHVGLGDIDAIAVTRGPGLPGSLVVGLNVAKGLALGRGLPLLGINHLEGHVYSLWLVEGAPEVRFPVIVLIVSGGHTELILMHDHGRYERLGGTLDDAAGEAFDKVARLLGLGYPGGPEIERAARDGHPAAYKFARPWLDGTWDFSFSGLKTAVLYEVKKQPYGKPLLAGDVQLDPLEVRNLAASFQAAVVEVLVGKTIAAAKAYNATEIFVAGGVSANTALREAFARLAPVPVRVPPLSLCTDNAAMIAAAANFRYLAGQRDALDIDALPNWRLA
ncbi:MAG: tRNA (adenosine(37)-N6)-threonylcarbamoyltransferase complex transferase subunit TsaD [Anaerolineales bacterium]|nr:tRNA (adenosine(37)-N6)-threonylcarbamoyltransferase complex transferase subunit TsaD [Anaerolineales bacterium]